MKLNEEGNPVLEFSDKQPSHPTEEYVPPHMRGGLRRYVENRIGPGGFLTAVLENNLVEACSRADMTNLRYLTNLVSYCYNEIPKNCWGSKERVANWLNPKEEK